MSRGNIMRLTNVRNAGLAALLVASSPLAAHDPIGATGQPAKLSPSAQGATATVDAFHAALRRGDTRSAAALLADDALIFEEGDAERTKAEYAGHHLPADAAFSQAVPSSVTSRAGYSDGTLAWIASEGRMTGTYKGKQLDRLTTETMVLRRVGKAWRIVHIHWSSRAPS
jgi:ketosteroid isomerase-like protein